jgi:peroxiredoxin
MTVNARLKTALSVAIFVMAAALSYVGVTHWPKPVQQTTKPNSQDTLAGIDGLIEGDIIIFPQMRTLKDEPAALHKVATEKFLFVFFTPSCAGCSLDAALWKNLHAESAKRDTAFYLIDVGHDRAALDNFIEAYSLQSLPILISEGRSVGQTLKVNIVPQYLLIEKGGKVLHRWDGVQHNKRPMFTNGNAN